MPFPTPEPTRRGEKDASHRLLQPTSLPSTNGLPDSRCTAAPRPPFDVRDTRASSPWVETPRRQEGSLSSACRMSLPGGASLDGEPPASTIVAERRATRWALALRSRVRQRVVLVESRSLTPPRAASRRRALFAPRRACDIASDVLCRAPPRIERRFRADRSPSLRSTEIRFPRRLVKGDALVESGRLPSPECSLPLSRRTLSRLRVGSRGARHRSRCSRAGGFRHRDPASDACSLGCARPPLGVRASQLDPRSCDRGPNAARRLLQPTQSASTAAPTARFPRCVEASHDRRALARFADDASPRRARAAPSTGRTRPKPRASRRRLPVESSPARGGSSFDVPRGSSRLFRAGAKSALPRPDPLGHLSS